MAIGFVQEICPHACCDDTASFTLGKLFAKRTNNYLPSVLTSLDNHLELI